ncbi:MAG: efflux RND transporter periplasmic adaptor subunit [Paludibacteraceae bacterium]|nr:efflux RND transporter periplasmic adaptor subunit [Paludibacteraceae bacterium]
MKQVNNNIRQTFLMVVLCGLLLPASCARWQKKDADTTPPPVNVRIHVVNASHSEVTRTYVGEVEENSSLSLSFATAGTVEQVFVREGDHVRKGDLLASVDKQKARNAHAAAKAALAQAEDGYKRLKQVYDQGSIAEVKWVEMQTNLEKARSMEAIAHKQLNDCDLYAPCDGVIGSCNAKVGANMLPGQSAMTLLDVTRVQVVFTVPENEIASIALGDQGQIEVPALNNQMFAGKITDRSLTANRMAHTYKVKIALDNARQQLLPGMVCKVHVAQPSTGGFVIDGKAVQTRPDGLGVWCVAQGHAVRRMVEVGQFVANGVLITNGLAQGDTLIVEGQQKLYEGAVVNIQN